MLCYNIWYYLMLSDILCYSIVFFSLYNIIFLNYITLYYIISYHIISYHIILYYIILYKEKNRMEYHKISDDIRYVIGSYCFTPDVLQTLLTCRHFLCAKVPLRTFQVCVIISPAPRLFSLFTLCTPLNTNTDMSICALVHSCTGCAIDSFLNHLVHRKSLLAALDHASLPS